MAIVTTVSSLKSLSEVRGALGNYIPATQFWCTLDGYPEFGLLLEKTQFPFVKTNTGEVRTAMGDLVHVVTGYETGVSINLGVHETDKSVISKIYEDVIKNNKQGRLILITMIGTFDNPIKEATIKNGILIETDPLELGYAETSTVLSKSFEFKGNYFFE